MEADSRDFSALERQMEHMQTNVANHATLVTSIARAVAKVRGGWTRFTASEKAVIQQELRTAERCARQLYDSALMHSEIAYAQGLVEAAAVYVAKPVATKEVVKKKYETVKEWSSGPIYMPGGQMSYDYEVRKYAADDPEGEYQLWCNNHLERDYTADMKKEAPAKVKEVDRLHRPPAYVPTPVSPAREDDVQDVAPQAVDMKKIEGVPATLEDIFEDIRALVQKVPADAGKERLSALVDVKKRDFEWRYDDGRYVENGQEAYGVIDAFVKEIRAALPHSDTESITVAVFLMGFVQELLKIFYTYGERGHSVKQRIQAVLNQYYTQAPMALKLAKLKRGA